MLCKLGNPILLPFRFPYSGGWLTYHGTVFLQRGSCIYSEKSYGLFHGSYYKIFMILRWPELEFSKINVFRAFYDPVTFGGFI